MYLFEVHVIVAGHLRLFEGCRNTRARFVAHVALAFFFWIQHGAHLAAPFGMRGSRFDGFGSALDGLDGLGSALDALLELNGQCLLYLGKVRGQHLVNLEEFCRRDFLEVGEKVFARWVVGNRNVDRRLGGGLGHSWK